MANEFNIFNEDCLTGMSKIPDGSVDCIITDPPYNITACAYECEFDLAGFGKEARRVLKPCSVALIFASARFAIKAALSNFSEYKYDWVWVKNSPTFFVHAKNAPMRLTERILVFSDGAVNHASLSKRRMKYNPQGLIPIEPVSKAGNKLTGSQLRSNGKNKFDNCYSKRPSHKDFYVQEYTNYPTEVLNYAAPVNGKRNHPNEKPVDLLEYLIRTYSDAGETVLDATMGSGSTGVAAINTGRNFIGFETEEKYFEIAKDRISRAIEEKEQSLFSLVGDVNADDK